MIDSTTYFRNLLSNPKDFDELKLYHNVVELFDESKKRFPHTTCVQWLDGQKTYEELDHDASLIVAVLVAHQVKKGDVVGLVFKNEYDFIVSFLAVARLGAIAALLPNSLPLPVLEQLSHVFNYKVLLCNDDKIASGLKLDCINVNMIDPKTPILKLNVIVHDDDPACIVFTGGTTGNPKGALISHKNICRGALNGTYVKGKAFHHKYLSLIPFTHIFGLVKNLMSSLLSGSTLYLCPNPATFVKESAVFQPDTMVLTPGLGSMVLMLLKNYGPNLFGPSFKTIICGGAAVPPSLINEFLKFGIECLPGYGLTEAANLVSGNGDIHTKPASVGIAYPGQELKVVNGELLIKGDNVFLGYYGNKEATNAILKDGWLHTGDLAKIDEEGFIYILGRTNNLIVLSSGLKIVPEEIESLIALNPLVKDAIVRKAKDNDAIEAEVLLFENNEENQNEANEYILKEVNLKINGDVKITKVVFRSEDFKRTPAMKIIR